ncbi:MAG: hypothetical protein OXS29_12915 [bacterium]|nr:hypothetical protein [bacterium]MDE0288383.1 hypothetical protein [bacterium]MDE0438711.1 hypothetical protein [bacterium]
MKPLRLAVLGNPVAHSLSPRIQRAALAYAGIEGTYVRRRVDPDGMQRAAADIRSGRLYGANVTMPHKGLAARLADDRSPEAQRCAGANTLWMEGGRLRAHTTDPDGVRFAWDHAGLPEDAPVLLLGAGGAAAAALAALDGRECRVSARREEAARALVSQVNPDAPLIGWGKGVPGAVVVNATPLGMAGDNLPSGVLDEAVGLLEMAYGQGETPAGVLLRSRGFPVAPGELMLVGQGVASFAIWTGVDVPPEVMLAALDEQGSEPAATDSP